MKIAVHVDGQDWIADWDGATGVATLLRPLKAEPGTEQEQPEAEPWHYTRQGSPAD